MYIESSKQSNSKEKVSEMALRAESDFRQSKLLTAASPAAVACCCLLLSPLPMKPAIRLWLENKLTSLCGCFPHPCPPISNKFPHLFCSYAAI